MATQTLEFSAGTGLTLSCKLFALGSDTVVDTQTATERTNDKNRYRVAFTNVPAGAYRMNAFVGATGGFANEVYDLLLATDIYYPRSESASGGGGGGTGDASQATLLLVKAKTDLITAGNVTYTSPVSPTGAIRGAIIIGDDYLAANARAFEWVISARAGYVVGTSTGRFGGSNAELGKSWLVTGTVSDLGGGEWKLSFDLNKTVTADLLEGYYRWSVELVSAGGTEVTEVYSGRNVEVRAKQT
jgi:hypothetical protein